MARNRGTPWREPLRVEHSRRERRDMYEQFGFSRSATGEQSLTLFVPDNTIDPTQYVRGGPCRIVEVRVIGDFQSLVDPRTTNWDAATGFVMNKTQNANGYLFTYPFDPPLPDGYYQYQYVVRFEDTTVRTRTIGDPCTKYGGDLEDRSAFVVGGTLVEPLGLDNRLPSEDLIVYELMIDDFTEEYRGNRPAIDAVVDKLDALKSLNINAVEFMPWIAWPDDVTFSWGYDPAYFFSVESAYVHDAVRRVDRLSRLANLITDVCKYWLTRFKLDGFRFDQVTGYDNPHFPQEGAPKLVADLKQYAQEQHLSNVSFILEDDWGYQVIQDANKIQPTGAWFDQSRSAPFGIFTGYAVTGQVNSQYMRVLNAARDFDSSICPTIYIENHDHGTVTCRLGSRDRWYKAQPYMIALATCSGTALIHNGQEWGQVEDLWEDDSNAPPQFRRVQPRPLRWAEFGDAIGQTMRDQYSFLMNLRLQHKGLRSPNFYPDDYDLNWHNFSPDGYGIDEQRQVIIYHRWGDAGDGRLERFMVVLNFSDATQYLDIPLSINGQWTDLLNGNAVVTTQDYHLHNYPVPSNWGCVFWQK